MALLNDHYITILGPQEEIKRFAVDFSLVPGEFDLGKGAVVDGEEMPSAALGMGYYTVTKCGVYCCGAIIEFTVRGEFFQPSCLFRQFCSDYPRLSFQWRYCLELDNGVGYVDAQGDHRYRENFSRDSAGSDDWIYELRTPDTVSKQEDDDSDDDDSNSPECTVDSSVIEDWDEFEAGIKNDPDCSDAGEARSDTAK